MMFLLMPPTLMLIIYAITPLPLDTSFDFFRRAKSAMLTMLMLLFLLIYFMILMPPLIDTF